MIFFFFLHFPNLHDKLQASIIYVNAPRIRRQSFEKPPVPIEEGTVLLPRPLVIADELADSSGEGAKCNLNFSFLTIELLRNV